MIDSANTTKGTIVSAQQSSTATTPNSTASSQTNWRERAQERWTEVLGKMYAMGQLVGWESIRRGMRNEDELAHREALGYQQALHGGRVPDPSGDDDMGDMILGDRVENHYHQDKPKGSKLGKVAALAALVLGGGVGAGTMVALSALDLFKDKEPEVQEKLIERESNESLEILPPVVREPE